MKRFLALTLAAALVFISLPAPLAAAGRQANGQIAGNVKCIDQSVLRDQTVLLRNMGTGLEVARQQTSTQGEFTFPGLEAGNYIVEVLDSNGKIIATSAQLALAAGAMSVTGVGITTSVGCVAAIAHSHRTIGIILAAAAGGGVAGYFALRDNASPSK